MRFMDRIEPLVLLLVIIGGLNWGSMALFDTNFVTKIFGGGTAADVIYGAVGIAALLMVPRLLDALHLRGGHHASPHGV